MDKMKRMVKKRFLIGLGQWFERKMNIKLQNYNDIFIILSGNCVIENPALFKNEPAQNLKKSKEFRAEDIFSKISNLRIK